MGILKGNSFPWHPPPYCELMLAQNEVNEEPTLIVRTDDAILDLVVKKEPSFPICADMVFVPLFFPPFFSSFFSFFYSQFLFPYIIIIEGICRGLQQRCS